MAGTRSKGDGSVYQTADGRWRATVEAGYGPNGRRLRRSVSARTRREVVEKLRVLLREIEAGMIGENPTLAEWLERWLVDICPARGLKPTTLAGYRVYVERWLVPTLGRRRVRDLRPDDVRRLHRVMSDAGRAGATIRQAHAILSRALKVAEREGVTSRNVAALVDVPSAPAKPHPALTPDEAKRVLQAARSPRELARLACAVVLGMRQGEALGLSWAAVDLDVGVIEVHQTRVKLAGKPAELGTPKSTAGHRTIPLPPAVVAILGAWREGASSAYVFPGPDGGLEPDHKRDWRAWRDACERAGVPAVPLHGARASAASLLAELGVPDRVIADILGHAQVQTTRRHYVQSWDQQRLKALEGAAEALDL